MRLTHLQADGLKSTRDLHLPIPHLLALTGPNGAGKSSILQTVTLSVLGFDPAIGRTLAATRKLSGGDGDIELGLTFDTGFGIRRTFGRSSRSEIAPPEGETTEAEKQERINAETGAFTPSFDLASMLALSAEKRRAALFALLPRELADLDQSEYRDQLGYAEATPAVQKAIDMLWAEKIHEASLSPTEGLASAIDFAHKRYLEVDRDRQAQEKVTAAAEKEAAQTAEAAPAAPGADLTNLQASLSAVEQQLGILREKRSEAERADRRRRERDERRAILARRIEDGEAVVARYLAQRDALQTQAPEALAEAEDALKIALDRSTGVDRLHAADEDVAATRLSNARTQAATAAAELDAARRQLAELNATLAELDAHEECPTCGSVDGIARARSVLRKQVEVLTESAQGLDQAASELIAERAAATEALTAVHQRRLDARAESDALVTEAQRTLDALRADRDAAARVTQNLKQAEALLAGMREERVHLDAYAGTTPVETEETFEDAIEERESAAFDLRDQIRALQDAAKEAGYAQAAIERAEKQRSALDGVTARAAALKGLYQSLQRYRGFVVRKMVAPVESMANAMLSHIDPAKRFVFRFEREGKDEFDFGFEEDGVFRSYDAASTGEDAFLAVVFVAALIAAVQPPWRVLLVDNVESVDDQRRRDLMEALALVADEFDNVILSGCAPFEEVDGWEIVDVRSCGFAEVAG